MGGCGKTVLTLNLGVALALAGHRILLVDGDPRGVLAATVGLHRSPDQGMVAFLRRRIAEDALTRAVDGLDLEIIAGGMQSPADVYFFFQQARQGVVASLIWGIAREYDYVLVDTASGYGPCTMVFWSVARCILMPVMPRIAAIRSMPLFLKTVRRVRGRLNPDLALLGLVLNNLDLTAPVELNIVAEMRTRFPRQAMFTAVIPRRHRFEQAAMAGGSVLTPPADSDLLAAYQVLLASDPA